MGKRKLLERAIELIEEKHSTAAKVAFLKEAKSKLAQLEERPWEPPQVICPRAAPCMQDGSHCKHEQPHDFDSKLCTPTTPCPGCVLVKKVKAP